MKYFLQLLLLCVFSLGANALYTIKIVINKYPPTNENLYLAGNIASWQPADTNFKFDKWYGEKYKLTLNVTANQIVEFKITQGSWQTVECASNGNDISNRAIKITGDTILYIDIAAWKNDFAPLEKKHTASPQVKIMDTAFYMLQLNRTRTIRIYLPKDYNTSNKRYPVLYMHDGQNCFDAYTSGYGE